MRCPPFFGGYSRASLALGVDWLRGIYECSAFLLAFFYTDLQDAEGMLLLVSGPMAVIAIAFWLNWKWRNEIRPVLKPG